MKRRLLAMGLLAALLAIGVAMLWRTSTPLPDPLAGVREKVGTRSATPLLEQLRNSHSRNAEVHFLSARQARLAGRLDEARMHLEQAESLHWSMSTIERERALQRSATDYASVQPALERLLAEDAAETDLLLAIGEGELQVGRRERAEEFAGRVLVRDPSNPRALTLRGLARLESRRLDVARTDLEAAFAAGPEPLSYPTARLALARCLLDLGEFPRARELFLATRTDDPTNLLALFGLGRSASYLGKFDEAEEAFAAVLKLRPGHVETLLGLAQVVEQRGDLPRALAYLEQAEKSEPNRLETISRLVKLLGALGQPERAAKYEARYRELDPTRKPLTQKPKGSP